jgi:hypothetical protein
MARAANAYRRRGRHVDLDKMCLLMEVRMAPVQYPSGVPFLRRIGLSEHGVIVRRGLRYGLQDVPVLDNLAVLQAEEVRRRGAAVFGRGLQQAVRHNHVALGDSALDVEAHLRELLREAQDELDERLEAVGRLGVVLYVMRSAILLRRLGGLPIVERHVVVGEHRLLVLLGVDYEFSLVAASPRTCPRWEFSVAFR